jgi:hypothetical protein
MTETDAQILKLCQELEKKRKKALAEKNDATLEDIYWSIKNAVDKVEESA